LEDGRLTDSLGRVVDFRNTIIIMTSNVGAEILQKETSLGFSHGLDSNQDAQKVKERILDEVKKMFKPEFLNRINELVIFKSLTKDHMSKIVDIELKKVFKRISNQNIHLDITQEAKNFLIEKGYDKKFGARPLRRAIEKYLEDPLAEEILKGEVKKEEPICVQVENNEKLIFEHGHCQKKMLVEDIA